MVVWKGREENPVKDMFSVGWLLLIMPRPSGKLDELRTVLWRMRGRRTICRLPTHAGQEWPHKCWHPCASGLYKSLPPDFCWCPRQQGQRGSWAERSLGIGQGEASHCQVTLWEADLSLQHRLEEEVGLRRSEMMHKKGLTLWHASFRITQC